MIYTPDPTFLPDYTLVDGVLVPGVAVTISGTAITSVGPPPPDAIRLAGQALLPGLINGHSHAFQRALRGRAESRHPDHPQDTFWTWREAMYHLADRLTPELLLAVTRMAYMEMLLSGITTVGEFHYLHHGSGGVQYSDPDEMAWQVVAAAHEVGIRVVLLRVAYQRAGFGRTAVPVQARFFDASPEACLEAVERLQRRGVAAGLAPHSVRAVSRGWLGPLHRYARAHRLSFHMHVAEQPAEVEACVAEHGLRPVQLLQREGLLDERFTAVHAVHLEDDEVAALGTTGATVCACPTTERNLGDGIVPADRLQRAGVPVSLGSDSHTQINLLEDARELEYHLRLQQLGRVLLSPGADLASRLWRSATVNGARSLGVNGGHIGAGQPADLVAVTLDDPSLVAASADELLTNIVFSMERTAIRSVWSEGRLVVQDGHHLAQDAIIAAYRKAIERIWRA